MRLLRAALRCVWQDIDGAAATRAKRAQKTLTRWSRVFTQGRRHTNERGGIAAAPIVLRKGAQNDAVYVARTFATAPRPGRQNAALARLPDPPSKAACLLFSTATLSSSQRTALVQSDSQHATQVCPRAKPSQPYQRRLGSCAPPLLDAHASLLSLDCPDKRLCHTRKYTPYTRVRPSEPPPTRGRGQSDAHVSL